MVSGASSSRPVSRSLEVGHPWQASLPRLALWEAADAFREKKTRLVDWVVSQGNRNCTTRFLKWDISWWYCWMKVLHSFTRTADFLVVYVHSLAFLVIPTQVGSSQCLGHAHSSTLCKMFAPLSLNTQLSWIFAESPEPFTWVCEHHWTSLM